MLLEGFAATVDISCGEIDRLGCIGFFPCRKSWGGPAKSLVVSPLHCPIHEDTTAPGTFDPAALAVGKVPHREAFRATGVRARRPAGRVGMKAWT
jgi:hypothetical protein